jgi:hypothetical protein
MRYQTLPRLFVACLLLLVAKPILADDKVPANWKEQRKKALDRPRRIILNNDGGEPVIEMKVATEQAFLDCRKLTKTHIDSIFYCTRTSGFGVFTHFTKIGQIFTCTEGRYAGNQMAALVKAGLDPLKMQVDFGHKNNIEVFWSLRMNDTHDGSKTDYGPILFRDNLLKNKHPEYLIGTSAKPPKYGAWTAVDFALKEVRELAFQYIEEVCRNYDIDGVELDFFRHPVFFKTTARGVAATQAECAGMTHLLERVRTLAEEVGRKRGRPILLAIKLPDSVAYCKAIGLDLETWLTKGLFDILIPGGYFQLNDWETSVALAHKHGLKVYPSLDEARLKDVPANMARNGELGYRGRAAAAWGAGGDGVYLFNFFSSESPLLKELGDPTLLATRDRDYFASPRGVGRAAGGNYPYDAFQKLETLNPGNPKALVAKQATNAQIACEAFAPKTKAELTLRVQFKNISPTNIPQATWNEHALQLKATADGWFEAPVDPMWLKAGNNRVTITPTEAPKGAVWLDAILQVRTK